MKILVCVRIGTDGEINPFDASAYELALSQPGAEVSLLSMGPASVSDRLLALTRLGARTAYLLSDSAFAGADTLATAYTLSRFVEMNRPDYVFCGRQTIIGDTGQTPVMLSTLVHYNLITNVMGITDISDTSLVCRTREEVEVNANAPALITVERINNLRLPSILSKPGEVKMLNSSEIGADINRCGLAGSPTRVIKTKENTSGRRKCRFIRPEELPLVIKEALNRKTVSSQDNPVNKTDCKVLCVTKSPIEYAKSISDNIVFCDNNDPESVISAIESRNPDIVLFGSDFLSKRVSATVAAKTGLGLCADCTALEASDDTVYMIRPALSGSVIAKIKSLTKPAIATVRTTADKSNIIVSAGYGAADCIDKIKIFADTYAAAIGTSRKAVDNNLLPYEFQVGLTGKRVSPAVYIAIGISGAVHHIVGMDKSGTVIAINPDKDAPIFDYADFGIIDKFENVFGGII